MSWEKAKYSKVILSEHQGNPLIEALPKKVANETVIDKLAVYPDHNDSERELEGFERQDYLYRIDLLRQPLPEYLQCFRMVEAAIKESYSTKNPFSPTTAYYLSYLSHSLPEMEPCSGPFEPKGSGMTIVGLSGVGKTKMLEQVLHYFPQVIEHDMYGEQPLKMNQLVWIKIECAHDSSLRGLCHAILSAIDKALRLPKTTPQRNIDTLLDQIEHKVKSCFIGVIAIDEMQNLNVGKAGGAENMLNFLLNLINRCGVPIIFCGNPEISDLFKQKFRIARRTENGGFIEIKGLEQGDVWSFFIEELWALQWTNVNTPLTEALNSKLLELSAGILDVAVRDYCKAQELVIDSGDERITVAVLEYAHSVACKQTEDSLQYLRRKKRSSSKVNSAAVPKNLIVDKDNSWLGNDSVVVEKVEPCKTIRGDLSRPQHGEFADKLRELQNSVDIFDRIVDPDLFQRASQETDPIDYLEQQKVLCVEPLKVLA
jgi:hypothetical protein